jgi:NACHT domain
MPCGLLKINVGKTILASRFIEECEKRDGVTSYFYCKESDPQRKESLPVLKGILAQMVAQERRLVPYFHSKKNNSGQGTLSAHELTKTLIKVACERITKQFIIIDGLDECLKDDRRVILSLLAEVVDKAEEVEPGKLRILIVSQAELDISEILAKERRDRVYFAAEEFAIEKSHNKSEIERFVERWASKIRQKFNLSSKETECIKDLMSEKTNGTLSSAVKPLKSSTNNYLTEMFLYAKLVLQNLFDQATRNDVVDELAEHTFPSGISEA